MQYFYQYNSLEQALSTAVQYGCCDFAAIESGLDQIKNGVEFSNNSLKPHQFASIALNAHGGIICIPLECMKYSRPTAMHETLLIMLRNVILKANDLAEFARYIHSIPGQPGCYRLCPYPKSGYYKESLCQ